MSSVDLECEKQATTRRGGGVEGLILNLENLPASSPVNMSWMELIASSGAGAVFAGGALLAAVCADLSAAWRMVSRVRES
jgi:hypothetical protein